MAAPLLMILGLRGLHVFQRQHPQARSDVQGGRPPLQPILHILSSGMRLHTITTGCYPPPKASLQYVLTVPLLPRASPKPSITPGQAAEMDQQGNDDRGDNTGNSRGKVRTA